ncbi:MAG: NAD-dependent dehydrogenase subunit [Planctomycetaceae bacterium]|nr:NAD-dependent dehydrogenase subunit [Planctomycetaceae bacterium]
MTNIILVFLVLTNLMLLGTGRISASIRIVAAQGVALSLLPLLIHAHGFGVRAVLLAAATVGLKGYLFPRLLNKAQRQASVRYEPAPFLSFSTSLMLGVASVGVAMWIGESLKLPEIESPLIVPAALSTIFIGLLLIVARKKALSQVLGYVVLENGIYVFGVVLAQNEPLLVELGILLDVFVAVFLMGIAIFHISREFDHIDVDQMTTLKH